MLKLCLLTIQVMALMSASVAAAAASSSSASSSLSTSSSSSSSSPLSRASMKKILAKARKLEENNNGDADQAEMEGFLVDYSLKFMKCIPDQVLTDADYNDHFGVVVFRLCPSNSCSDEEGCTSGYADFAVDVGTYVEAFMEDQQDNMNWDDKFDGEMFGQCVEYEDDDNGETGYYIGPGCTEDGTGVRMAVFEDKYCYQVSETSFETISNGWSLPYTEGGVVSTKCLACMDNDGAVRDMCLDLYDVSPYRCETDFDFDHYYYDNNFEIYRYGKDKTGCTKIEVMQSTKKKAAHGAVWQDLIISVMLLITAAGGFALYTVWWRKQKENLERIDDDDDDESGYHQQDDASNGDGEHDDGELVRNPSDVYQEMEDNKVEGTMA
mmetsp:Transcript_8932/g.14327  ORF Transcript_8932/g.14327 Transcript_8932/m.14327 type:complete len:381 (-) Transcript_8932:267-1409(-)